MDKYTKAIVAALVAGLSTLQTALLDGTVTVNEWVMVGAAAVGALGLTWAVPNASKDSKGE